MLFPILHKKSAIHKKFLILIYRQILRPLLTHACPIWGNCSSAHIRKIQIFQNKILRIITNTPWFIRKVNLHKDLQILEIQDHIRAFAKNVHSSLQKSTGSLDYNLHIRSPPNRRLKCGCPHDLIS
uniref:Putative RNA-directed DNA polymerase n=1 Tax=Sipha flava TaxID=143950 RepID=A0A2S2R865_9HEMI